MKGSIFDKIEKSNEAFLDIDYELIGNKYFEKII